MTFTVEHAPIKLGPWRIIESVQGDNYLNLVYKSIKLGLQQPYPWVRVVPEGNVKRAILIRR